MIQSLFDHRIYQLSMSYDHHLVIYSYILSYYIKYKSAQKVKFVGFVVTQFGVTIVTSIKSPIEYVKDVDTKELIFSPTPIAQTTFGAVVPMIDGQAPKTNIRILYDGGEQTCGSYDIIDGGVTGTYGVTTYPAITHFDNALTPSFDINFGTCDFYYYNPQTLTNNTLYNMYWRRTINQINEGKMLTAFFKLTENDIHGLKLSDKIRIR